MTLSAHEALWRAPIEPLALGATEVHIWHARLDLPAPDLQALEQTLAAVRRQRASAFRFARGRSHFIAARGILRALLGRYLGKKPHTLQFIYNAYGKPALAGELVSRPLLFDVTHSQNVALYAFTRMGNIGIDLEQMAAEVRDYEQIAQRFFSTAEVEALRAMPVERRQEAFLNCWTRKEAYILQLPDLLKHPLPLLLLCFLIGSLVTAEHLGQLVEQVLLPFTDQVGMYIMDLEIWNFVNFGDPNSSKYKIDMRTNYGVQFCILDKLCVQQPLTVLRQQR